MSFKYEIPNINDPFISADWVEFYLIATGNNISKAEYQDFLESTQGYDADESDLGIIDSIWQILEERQAIYGAKPPYTVENNVVRGNIDDWRKKPYLLMCLIFSLEGNDHVDGYTPAKSGTLFEKIIKEATKIFFQGKSYIFGYPNESLEQFCSSLDLIEYLSEMPADFNDGGLDVLGTGPFSDDRNNDLSIIIQCAAGKNWPLKIGDVNIDEWVTWLKFSIVPTKGFAVPIFMKKRDIDKKSKRMGLLIDRPRIYRSLEDVDISTIKLEVETWCDIRLTQMIA